MFPHLFSIGSWSLSSFGVFAALSLVAGAFFFWRAARDRGIPDSRILDNFIITSTTSFLGARLLFVLSYWPLFSPNLLRIAAIWKFPGLSVWGAFVFGVAGFYFFSRSQKLNLAVLFDCYGVAIPVAMVFLSLGVMFDGSLVGKPTSWPVGAYAVGVIGKRQPVGIYAITLALLLCLLVFGVRRKIDVKKFPGLVGWFTLSVTGMIQLLLALGRENLLYFKGISPELILATVLVIGPLSPIMRQLSQAGVLKGLSMGIRNALRSKK